MVKKCGGSMKKWLTTTHNQLLQQVKANVIFLDFSEKKVVGLSESDYLLFTINHINKLWQKVFQKNCP